MAMSVPQEAGTSCPRWTCTATKACSRFSVRAKRSTRRKAGSPPCSRSLLGGPIPPSEARSTSTSRCRDRRARVSPSTTRRAASSASSSGARYLPASTMHAGISPIRAAVPWGMACTSRASTWKAIRSRSALPFYGEWSPRGSSAKEAHQLLVHDVGVRPGQAVRGVLHAHHLAALDGRVREITGDGDGDNAVLVAMDDERGDVDLGQVLAEIRVPGLHAVVRALG